MNFLEANKILKNFSSKKTLSIRLMASGTIDPLIIFFRAALAKHGFESHVVTIPFGTLMQTLQMPANEKEVVEVALLMPWDLCPELDWRSGIPKRCPNYKDILAVAEQTVRRVVGRGALALYLDAPVPPILSRPDENASLSAELSNLVRTASIRFLKSDSFSLANYLANGVPLAGTAMGTVGEHLTKLITSATSTRQYKVLATDLDNVMWSGLIAEDGPDGILCRSEGKGFKHFIYQSFLTRLKNAGILIAAVSRNDIEVAKSAIFMGKTLLSEHDFVSVQASYEPKSLHIRRLAEKLNLGLDSFVFVDDNPIELAEVHAALPQVRGVQFPHLDDDLPSFFQELATLFPEKGQLTDEDRQRTELYRRRFETLEQMDASTDTGGDITEFLKSLKMSLVITDRSIGNRERAVQLINKTNQFNLNGRRISDEDVGEILSCGGKLFTATLEDRTGAHGEILVCLVDSEGTIQSLVLSCRVFQRRVEHAFLSWLLNNYPMRFVMDFAPTEKNTPIRDFLKLEGIESQSSTRYSVARDTFLSAHASNLNLFQLTEAES